MLARTRSRAISSGLHDGRRVSIVHGTVNFTDPVTKRRLLAEDMTASATVRSFDGPLP
jgi:hypothetical protein